MEEAWDLQKPKKRERKATRKAQKRVERAFEELGRASAATTAEAAARRESQIEVKKMEEELKEKITLVFEKRKNGTLAKEDCDEARACCTKVVVKREQHCLKHYGSIDLQHSERTQIVRRAAGELRAIRDGKEPNLKNCHLALFRTPPGAERPIIRICC